jgi:hypothetical protein
MKGDATTHTTNAAYRAGWERVFGHSGFGDDSPCWECGGEIDPAAANNVYCSACLAKP